MDWNSGFGREKWLGSGESKNAGDDSIVLWKTLWVKMQLWFHWWQKKKKVTFFGPRECVKQYQQNKAGSDKLKFSAN